MENQDKVIINGVEYVREETVNAVELSDRVIVRTRNAGVWVGTLGSRDAVDTVLLNANRVWRWRGANTLSEMSRHGVNRTEYTRISEMVDVVTLTTSDTCEIIPVAAGVDLTEVWND